MAVVPSSKSSMLSKLLLIFVPQVSSEAPTSGLVKLYVVVVVSAIIQSYAATLTGASVHATLSSSVASVHVSLGSASSSHFKRALEVVEDVMLVDVDAFAVIAALAVTLDVIASVDAPTTLISPLDVTLEVVEIDAELTAVTAAATVTLEVAEIDAAPLSTLAFSPYMLVP